MTLTYNLIFFFLIEYKMLESTLCTVILSEILTICSRLREREKKSIILLKVMKIDRILADTKTM